MKQQGILPIIDKLRKTVLGVYLLPYSKTFNGTETTHNVNFPAASNSTNTVPIEKIMPQLMAIGSANSRQQNDWFMAAVFTHAEIRDKAYAGYPNYYGLNDVMPAMEWVSCQSHPGQLREYLGPVLNGLRSDWITGKPDETTYTP